LSSIASKGQNNVAFASYNHIGNTSGCVDVLLESGRAAEAALYARTYAPSEVPRTLSAWKNSKKASGVDNKKGGAGRVNGVGANGVANLKKEKRGAGGGEAKAVEALADPEENPEAFVEGWEEALRKEQEARKGRRRDDGEDEGRRREEVLENGNGNVEEEEESS
jgi:coatomer subunit beta'